MHRHLQQGAAHLSRLASMLSDGRPFLLSDAPSAADLAAYSPFWALKDQAGVEAVARLPFEPLRGWAERIAAIGYGRPTEMTAAEALAVARAAEPQALSLPPAGDPSGLKSGEEVIVMADDTGRDPVRGRLIAADAEELVIRSSHPLVGEINIHSPRAGFDVVAV